jgi:hypothetical protein
MTKIVAFGALLVLLGCASHRAARTVALQEHGDPSHPLYVGHSDTGDVVVAASHFDAMSGTAVAAAAIGEKGDDKMICVREMLTGTHIPTWVCRYQNETDFNRNLTQDLLKAPRNCTSRDCIGN